MVATQILGWWEKHPVEDAVAWAKARGLDPSFSFGEDMRIGAILSARGWLRVDPHVDLLEMMQEYLRLIQEEYCCGKCITGKKGSLVLLDVLDRYNKGVARPEDPETLRHVAATMQQAAKCSVCQTAGRLLQEILGLQTTEQEALGSPKAPVRYVGALFCPCMAACPAHIKIPLFIEMIREMDNEGALEIIRETMPLPGICGRICPHDCERACSLAHVDSAIPIKLLKRLAADHEVRHKTWPDFSSTEKKDEAMAVVGAGPAGLSAAYYLARMGYPVTVFESLPRPGGMISVGIPPYRQPRDILEREIKIIEDAGVEFRMGEKWGQDFSLSDLEIQGFKAIFLAIGAHRSARLGVPGEEDGLEGYIPGIDFLRQVNLGERPKVGHRVLVLGGGNTAIDCARTCLRLGAHEVHIVYRRTREEMPASREEVEETDEEGIQIHELTGPIEIMGAEGRVTGLRCIRMELGEPDDSGRRRPVPVEGSEFVMPADQIIPAIGQSPELSILTDEDGLKVTRWGTLEVAPDVLMTSREGVFAGGDLATGPLTVVHAVGAGRRAALMMDRYVRTGRPFLTDEDQLEDFLARLETYEGGLQVPPKIPLAEGLKTPPAKLPVAERIESFREVESGMSQRSSLMEASRCLRCVHLTLVALSPVTQELSAAEQGGRG